MAGSPLASSLYRAWNASSSTPRPGPRGAVRGSISGHTPCPHTVEACFQDHPAMPKSQRLSGFALAFTCARSARAGRGDQALA